ncbi:MAG: hypothetical protein ABIG95_02415, partial [Candidatus Woesearchaeota archaeon]
MNGGNMKYVISLFLVIFLSMLSPAYASQWVVGVTGGAGGIGDVVGPVSSTDNAIARYHLVTGKIIQNSLITIDDTGIMTLPAGSVTAPSIVSDDADSGFYFGSKGFNWGVDGVNVFYVNSAGGTVASNGFYAPKISTVAANSTLTLQDAGGSGSAAKSRIIAISGTDTSTALQQNGLVLYPTYNQASGTAANTDLLILRNQTRVGSGLQYFFDMQVNATSWYNFRLGTTATTGAFDFTADDTAKVAVTFTPILGIMDAGDEISVLKLAPTSAVNHTGGTLNGLTFDNITGDADAAEYMFNITGTGWDATFRGTASYSTADAAGVEPTRPTKSPFVHTRSLAADTDDACGTEDDCLTLPIPTTMGFLEMWTDGSLYL